MTLLQILAGLILLAGGGEMLVRGAVGVARVLGLSPLLVGLTIVGFGTSTPELVTSLFAALDGSPGIAVGNVVGSNIANILLILGVSALIAPLVVRPAAFRRDGIALGGSTLACLAAVFLGVIDQTAGIGLVVLLVAYVGWAYRSERPTPDLERAKHEHAAADAAPPSPSLLPALAIMAIGIGTTILGARLLVDGAIDIARAWGASETLIGLTIVAVGTSLPELVACVIAAMRRQSDVALGNVIGSNIYNVLGILGVTAIVHPIEVPPEIVRLDIWVLLGASASLLMFLRSGWTLKRWEGGVFVAAYAGYVGYLVIGA